MTSQKEDANYTVKSTVCTEAKLCLICGLVSLLNIYKTKLNTTDTKSNVIIHDPLSSGELEHEMIFHSFISSDTTLRDGCSHSDVFGLWEKDGVPGENKQTPQRSSSSTVPPGAHRMKQQKSVFVLML